MAKTQKQRSAEFRARRDPEVRGIFAPVWLHEWIKDVIADCKMRNVTIATKRAKEKA